MKLNKFKAIIPAVALLFTSGITSCMDDLDKGNLDPTVVADVDINGLYAKCYAGLIMEGNDGNADFTIQDAGRSTLLRNLFNFNSLPTDESICWWSDGGIVDICYNQCVPGTPTLKFLYYRLVSNIGFCNHYLEVGADGDPTMLAEVRFLRAYNYYLMLDFFGDPSFTTALSSETPKQAHAYNSKFVEGNTYTRAQLLSMGREFLFNWVKDEILAAEPNLMEAKAKDDKDPNYGRVDKAGAWLLLSRLYLNAGVYLNNDGQNNPYWQDALTYAEKVIDPSTGYALFDDTKISAEAKANGYKPYDLLFMGDNGSNGATCEAILPLKQDGITTRGWGGTRFFIAAMWDGDMKTATGLSAATTDGAWSGMRFRPQFLEKFTSAPATFEGKTAKDIRALNIDDRAIIWGKETAKEKRTISLGSNTKFVQGLASPKWNNNYSTGATPHDPTDVDIDFFLFRAAEAYLNAAEAEIHLNGVTSSKAQGYINAIRNRAHATPKSISSVNDVLDERAREFYFEGHRRVDLIRFNKYGGQDSYNWDYKNGIADGTSKIKFDKSRNLFPLPSSEIMANKNLTQIDGYSEIEE
jgi:hypothetical protein